MSAIRGIVLQKSFKNSKGRRRGFHVEIRGTSSPHAKLIGDFGGAIEAMQIIDLFAFQVLSKEEIQTVATCRFGRAF